MVNKDYGNLFCSFTKIKFIFLFINKVNKMILYFEIIHMDVNVKGSNEI